MALDYIEIKDAAGVSRKVSTDLRDTDKHDEVVKMSYGAEDSAPTLISPTTPMPSVHRRTSVWQGHNGTNHTYTAVTVTSTATLVLESNTGRLAAHLFNDSDVNIFIGPTSSVAASGNYKGIPVSPGQFWPCPVCYTGTVYAIVATGSETMVRGEFAETESGA